jgi:hypothetical protein
LSKMPTYDFFLKLYTMNAIIANSTSATRTAAMMTPSLVDDCDGVRGAERNARACVRVCVCV